MAKVSFLSFYSEKKEVILKRNIRSKDKSISKDFNRDKIKKQNKKIPLKIKT